MKITYEVSHREYGDLPFKKIYEWAKERGAVIAFLELLDKTFLGWGNKDMAFEVFFYGPDEKITKYRKDAFSVEVSSGDVVINHSLVDKDAEYREDSIKVYQWDDDKLRWHLRTQESAYYSRAFPFGGYTKPMSIEWGISKKPRIWFGNG